MYGDFNKIPEISRDFIEIPRFQRFHQRFLEILLRFQDSRDSTRFQDFSWDSKNFVRDSWPLRTPRFGTPLYCFLDPPLDYSIYGKHTVALKYTLSRFGDSTELSSTQRSSARLNRAQLDSTELTELSSTQLSSARLNGAQLDSTELTELSSIQLRPAQFNWAYTSVLMCFYKKLRKETWGRTGVD